MTVYMTAFFPFQKIRSLSFLSKMMVSSIHEHKIETQCMVADDVLKNNLDQIEKIIANNQIDCDYNEINLDVNWIYCSLSNLC